MDAIEAIMTRRSIRSYTEDPISQEQVQTLLEAAMMAPSAGNGQPWQFLVIQDKATLAKIKDANAHAAMATQAPLAVLICGDLTKEKSPGYWVQDCSAATENMLLAAHAMGLGAVWTGIHTKADREKGFRELFQLPDHIMPLSLVVVGHPAKQSESQSRFDSDKVHYERW
jgi:nitroreductase